MNFEQLLDNITPDICSALKRAVELGKWPNGQALTGEQRELCMQGIIAYEHKHLPPEQHTGFIAPKEHSHCGSAGAVADAEQPLKILDA